MSPLPLLSLPSGILGDEGFYALAILNGSLFFSSSFLGTSAVRALGAPRAMQGTREAARLALAPASGQRR